MTVYADILFFVNFFMNYLVISICTAIVPEPTKNRRKLLASLLGGIYGVCVFIPDLALMYSVPSVFLFSAAMVAVLFCPCRAADYLRALSVFYISSFMLSGGIYMLLPYFGGGAIRNNILYFDSVKMLVLAGAVTLFGLRLLKYVKSRINSGGFFVSVRYGKSSATVHGIHDTGNLLCTPHGGDPVIVADEELLKRLFAADCTTLNLSEWVDSRDIRLIPYQGLGTDGVMTGFLADEVCIGRQHIKNVVIAISPNRLRHGLLINSAILLKG